MFKYLLMAFIPFAFSYNAVGFEGYVLKKDRSLSQNIETGNGLKILWWNIGCSSTKGLKKINQDIRDEFHPKNQLFNLKNLSSDDEHSPDMIVLGEYCPKYFDTKTTNRIKDFYPHVFHVEKSNPNFKIRNGLIVFSKLELKVLKNVLLGAGDFLDKDYMKTCAKEQAGNFLENTFNPDFWTRPLIELEIFKNNKAYKVVPVHLANPWRLIHKCLGESKIYTGIELISGTENPNYFQSLELSNKYENSFSTVLIGDFNAPRSIQGFASSSYKRLKESLGSSVMSSSEPTFFDERSGFGSFSLDHAFVSDDLRVEYEMVLPFSGSDHLPIYITVD